MRLRVIQFPTICLFFLFRMMTFSYAQADYSTIFLNYKRSFVSNFLNGEFQLGNKDEMHFFTLQVGVNLSGYSSLKYCPYYTGTVALDPDFIFSEYMSKKKGFQLGIGYTHYFKNLENEKQYIPYFSFDMNAFRNLDEYTLEYTQLNTGAISEVDKEYRFLTLSSSLQGGLIYATQFLFYKLSLGFEYYLPMNDHTYMPTDSYNAKSSKKLPLVGVEPFLQLGIGFKLF